MPDAALQAALRRNAEIDRQIKELEGEKQKIGEWIQMYRKFSGNTDSVFLSSLSPIGGESEQKTRRGIADTAYQILSTYDAPVSTHDLLNKLDGEGVVVGGKDRVTNLSSALSRDDRFRSIKGVGWVLADDERYKPRALLVGEEGQKKTASVFD